ncbi:MAG: cold-shock protein [Methanobacteriota archaeon]|nr:MAG: cold-shock protein [Euryarchaeota archaeon]
MATGTVKFYNRMKRFGFIAQDEGEDVFVHESGIVEGPINDNDRVEFDVEEGPKGLKAVNVRRV